MAKPKFSWNRRGPIKTTIRVTEREINTAQLALHYFIKHLETHPEANAAGVSENLAEARMLRRKFVEA